MNDAGGLAVQLIALRVLEVRVKARIGEVKAELQTSMGVGDRVKARMVDGKAVGSVTYTEGRETVRVVDARALADFVADNWPDEVIPQVRPSFLKAVQDMFLHGDAIPGLDLVTGEPYLSARPDPDAVGALVDAIRANQELALS